MQISLVMGVRKRSIVAVLCLVIFPSIFLYSEGTKQIMPGSSDTAQLCLNKSRNDFAFYDGAAEYRLNISIANASERIQFGFGQVFDYNGKIRTDLEYRIKGPSGNTVFGPFSVPSSNKGFIASYSEAFTGVYNFETFQPTEPGDYYLEFYYPPGSGYTQDNRRYLGFFDITVVKASGEVVNGRVWSKAWQFWSQDDPFNSKMMILSDDSIVTQVNCNGFHGGSFSFSSNKTGCDITGILSDDRQSRGGNHLYPQYKVFLNNPDSMLFPTQKLISGSIQSVAVNPNCTGGADFIIGMARKGTISILIKNNPAQGTQTEVIQIIRDVTAGNNIIVWDGKDLYGVPVSNGKPLVYSVTNLSGLTHLPLFDIETNANGLIVNQVRPKGGQMKIYWDDTQITGGTSNATSGCVNTGGCHTWSNDFGNNNTINSWWFVTGSEISDKFFVSIKSPSVLTISGNNIHCEGPGKLDFSVTNDPNSTSYTWVYTGTGVSIAESGTTATLSFAADATAGTLYVNGYNNDCGNGPVTSMNISIEHIPNVTLEAFDAICYTAPGFELAGGEPQGGKYFVHSVEADSVFPYKEPEGLLPVVYSYTNPAGCPNSDTADILLYSGTECLGTVFFPNAFKPDGDSLNDVFRPVARNISTFKMYIFNRWGELIYSTDNASQGWDGTFDGKACPAGTYTFTSTFGLSLRKDNTETKRGTFTLVR